MGKKELNPADAFRKKERKKQLQKAKKDRKVVQDVRDLLSDPKKIEEEIQKVQKESDENKLDKSLKDRIKELKMMHGVAIKKVRIKEDQERLKSQSMLGAYQRDQQSWRGKGDEDAEEEDDDDDDESSEGDVEGGTVAVEDSLGSMHDAGAIPAPQPRSSRFSEIGKPEDSVYYHPIYNPTGEAPPGQSAMYRKKEESEQSVPAAPSAPLQPKVLLQGAPAAMQRLPPTLGHPPPPMPPVMPLVGGQNGVPLPPPRLPPPPPPPTHGMDPVGGPPLPPMPSMGGMLPMHGHGHMYGPGGMPAYGYPQQGFQGHMGFQAMPPRGPGGPGDAGMNGGRGRGGHGGMRGSAKALARRRGAEVDPLDPNADGYTERFENPYAKKAPARQPHGVTIPEADIGAAMVSAEEEEERLIEMRLQQQLAAIQRENQADGGSAGPLNVPEFSAEGQVMGPPIQAPEIGMASAEDIKAPGASLPPGPNFEVSYPSHPSQPSYPEAGPSLPGASLPGSTMPTSVAVESVSQPVSHAASAPALPTPSIDIMELMKRRRMVTSNEAPPAGPSAGPSLPAGPSVGPSMPDSLTPMNDVGPMPGPGPSLGPSMGPIGPSVESYDGAMYPTAEEMLAQAADPASGPANQPGMPTSTTAPPSIVSSGGVTSSGLGSLLGGYGSDSDEDEDNDDTGNGVPITMGQGAAAAAPHMAPPVSNARETLIGSSNTLRAPTLGPSVGTSEHNTMFPKLPNASAASGSVTVSMEPSEEPTPAPVPAKLLGPKIMKKDPALTAFVPTSLRKRAGGSGGGAAVKQARLDGQKKDPKATVAPSAGQSRIAPAPVPTTSVDDAYSSFLDEINQLTGT